MSDTWVLVAESSRAKLYKVNGRLAPLTEIEAMVNPASRMREAELVSDDAGSDSAHERESLQFAKRLANRLDSGRTSGDFNRLVLVAPPQFLGHLRNHLSKESMSMVYRQIDKNLVQKSKTVLRTYL
jgi:protein required for attachment to host cells